MAGKKLEGNIFNCLCTAWFKDGLQIQEVI